jgi:hypothetical protein
MGFLSKKTPGTNSKYGISVKAIQGEDSFLNWSTLARRITDGLAADWFAEYQLVSLKESIRPRTVSELFDILTPFGVREDMPESEPRRVIPNLMIEVPNFGERVQIEESKLGRLVMETLNARGVKWSFGSETVTQRDGSDVEVIDPFMGLAHWQTAFGLPVAQTFEIYLRDGREFCYWSAEQLLCTRPFEQFNEMLVNNEDDPTSPLAALSGIPDDKTGEVTFGEWSTHFYIPMLAQSLFYLVETPLPSGLFSLSRAMGYKGIDPNNLPRPRLMLIRNRAAFGLAGNEIDGAEFPACIAFGWEFSYEDSKDIEIAIETMADGLVNISSCLEDGFLNHANPESGYSWDWALFSACVLNTHYVEGGSHLGYPFWIPATFAGAIAAESREIHSKLDVATGDEQVHLAEALALDGVGYSAVCGINTMAFSVLRGHAEENEWFIDHLLDCAVRFEIENESTNALSNWGIIKFEMGDLDGAKDKFLLALAREDRYAEAEASHYMSLICEAKNNAILAEEYKRRCKAAGGYP